MRPVHWFMQWMGRRLGENLEVGMREKSMFFGWLHRFSLICDICSMLKSEGCLLTHREVVDTGTLCCLRRAMRDEVGTYVEVSSDSALWIS